MAVRITQGTTNRTYLKNLNGSQSKMNKAMERVETGRDFQRVSDNVTKATRAISVRERLYRNEQMTDNVNTATEQLKIAEESLKEMGEICSNVQSEMFKAMNSMTLQAGKESFSSFLDGARDEIMRLANTKYNDKYVLGGLGIDVAPFKADEDGNMVYNPQSSNSNNYIKLNAMTDKNQMINDIKTYDSHIPTNIPASDQNKVFVCDGNLKAKLVDFNGLKEYLGMKDQDTSAVISQYGQNANSSDSNVWEQGHYWVPANGCCHDDQKRGFIGHFENGDPLVDVSIISSKGKEYHLKEVNPVTTSVQSLTTEQIQSNVENYYSDGVAVKYSGDSYMDIGLDMSVSGLGKVESKTAFKTTVDGIAAMGYGRTDVSYDEIKGIQASAGYQGTGNSGNKENVSNNIYDMLTEMKNAIDGLSDDSMNGSDMANVIDKISAVMVNFKKQTDKIISAESELGVRSRFLDTNLDRLEQENTSLKKMQKDIEGVDDATEITNFMSYQNAWNMVLQFGKNIVPKSLMDYVN